MPPVRTKSKPKRHRTPNETTHVSTKSRPAKTSPVRPEPERTKPKPKFYRTGLLTKRIPNRSLEAKIYARNSAESPLLRLPAEIRIMIWKYALGGNTILMKLKLKKFKKLNRGTFADKRRGIMGMEGRFSCLTFQGNVDPFSNKSYKDVTLGFTLLNGVCRQLYKETALLPYELNTWASIHDYVFWRYTVKEKRLLIVQRKAIKTFYGHHYFRLTNDALFRFPGETKTFYYNKFNGVSEYQILCGRVPVRTFIQDLPRQQNTVRVLHDLDGSVKTQ